MGLRRVDLHFDSANVLQLYPETQEAVFVERFAYSGMPKAVEKTTIGHVYEMLAQVEADRTPHPQEGEDDTV